MPLRLAHVRLFEDVLIGVQLPPPSVEEAHRMIDPLYPVMDNVPLPGDGQTTPPPVKVPPLGAAPTVTVVVAAALPTQMPVGSTVYE